VRLLKQFIEYAKPLAAAMIMCLGGGVFPDFSTEDIDVIMPVPRHPDEMKIDGETGQRYNQAEVLADYIAKSLRKPLLTDVLEKTIVFSMHDKNRDERIALARSGYTIKPDKASMVENKNILLVDDIRTSGATLDACARQLKRAGARKVYAYVAGRTIDVEVVRRCLE